MTMITDTDMPLPLDTIRKLCFAWAFLLCCVGCAPNQPKTLKPPIAIEVPAQSESIAAIQEQAIVLNKSDVAHWGTDRANYTQWKSHSNRLIPVYTFGTKGGGKGIDLAEYSGVNSAYRSEEKLRAIYGFVPKDTVDPNVDYLDQTNIFDIQAAAIAAGKKHVFVVIFDGMCWHDTRAAALAVSGRQYDAGRGTGLFWLDYHANDTTQFGFMATAPYCDKARVNPSDQSVGKCEPVGGYSAHRGGEFPWSDAPDKEYPKGTQNSTHPYTDSASSASSMGSRIKTFNYAVNVRPDGSKSKTIAQIAHDAGYATGTVTSVPFCHATPAGFSANNVSRNDYQDLGRDMLGLRSVSHPKDPLPGVDVIMGTGFGKEASRDDGQGTNFVPGNIYITADELKAVDIKRGGKYVVCQRTTGKRGAEALESAAAKAIAGNARLLAMFGTQYDHLPFRTANGGYKPVKDNRHFAEKYSNADLLENPKLEEMTESAISVLASKGKFWLMVEAGDVDWASHWNSLDNMIGAVVSGDRAIERIAKWVEMHSNWGESVMIVTSDHGHYFMLDKPEAIAGKAKRDS